MLVSRGCAPTHESCIARFSVAHWRTQCKCFRVMEMECATMLKIEMADCGGLADSIRINAADPAGLRQRGLRCDSGCGPIRQDLATVGHGAWSALMPPGFPPGWSPGQSPGLVRLLYLFHLAAARPVW
jgi:hypothetical protein